jgi:hypothetical protein
MRPVSGSSLPAAGCAVLALLLEGNQASGLALCRAYCTHPIVALWRPGPWPGSVEAGVEATLLPFYACGLTATRSNGLTAAMPPCLPAVRCGNTAPLPPSPPPEPIFDEPLAPPYDPMDELPCGYTLEKGELRALWFCCRGHSLAGLQGTVTA